MEQALEETRRVLVVGLGNPGEKYRGTRHNLGFSVVDRVAERRGVEFREETFFKGRLGAGLYKSVPFFLLKPSTFMNASGQSIAELKKYYGVSMSHILILSDDVALPFGKKRLAERGGSGGHLGLESIENLLSTKHYARLRIGIGDRDKEKGEVLADYVLSSFSAEEKVELPKVIEEAALIVEGWIEGGINLARAVLHQQMV